VVPNPDHPLLIRGPDIIISIEQSLFALFTPSAEERQSPSRLKPRFVLSRLALPTHTRFLLVIEPSGVAVAQYFSNDFADIIEWSRRSRIVQIASNKEYTGRHRDVPAEIIGDAQLRFANAMTVMHIVARLSRRPFSAAFAETTYGEGIATSRPPQMRRTQRVPVVNRTLAETGGVAFAEMLDFDVDASAVRELIDDQVNYSYVLDNGIPYQSGDASGLAVVRDWPIGHRDPDKLIHAAAFAGWAFVLEENRNELRRFARRLKQRRAQ